MDTGHRILPIPLWVEYSRIKKALTAKLESQRESGLLATRTQSQRGSILDRSSEFEEARLHCMQDLRPLSPSLTSNKSSEDLPGPSPRSEKPPLCPPRLSKASSPLKQTVLSLKQSVQALRLNSADLYKSMSYASTNFSSTYSSPTSIRAEKLHFGSTSKSPNSQRSDTSQLVTLTDEKSVQAEASDYCTHYTSGKRFVCTPSIPEADLSESDSHLGLGESPTTPPPPKLSTERVQSPRFCTSKKLRLLRQSEGGSQPSHSRLRANTDCVYFMKALCVGGRVYSADEAKLELRIGKVANQPISLKGDSARGGFHLFSHFDRLLETCYTPVQSAAERLCVLRVNASGSSLRYSPARLSPHEVVYSSIVPLEVVPSSQGESTGKIKAKAR